MSVPLQNALDSINRASSISDHLFLPKRTYSSFKKKKKYIYIYFFLGNRVIWPQTQNSEGCTERNVPPSLDSDNRVPHSDSLPKVPLTFQEVSRKAAHL